MYIPHEIPSYISHYKKRCHSLIQNSVSKSQALISDLNKSKWIIIFKHYMNDKMMFSPTSMCRVTLTLSPYFTGIFIWPIHVILSVCISILMSCRVFYVSFIFLHSHQTIFNFSFCSNFLTCCFKFWLDFHWKFIIKLDIGCGSFHLGTRVRPSDQVAWIDCLLAVCLLCSVNVLCLLHLLYQNEAIDTVFLVSDRDIDEYCYRYKWSRHTWLCMTVDVVNKIDQSL